MISNKYIVLEKLGNGSFGTIFKGENIRTKEKVAIKMCSINNKYNLLKNEAKVYQLIGNIVGFPQLKWFGTENENQYLVIDLLGQSLSQFKKQYGKLSHQFVANIGIQIISRLHVLHSIGLIHRDIKPDNFVFGINNNCNLLYLIDYGFSTGYTEKESKQKESKQKDSKQKHSKQKDSKQKQKNSENIIGTVNYISLNVHKKYEPGRRDDIESVCYILIYLLDLMSWERYKDSSINNILQIVEEKENIIHSEKIPIFIRKLLTYIRNISMYEEPNYTLMKSFLMEIIMDH